LARDHGAVVNDDPAVLLDRFAALPAAPPLLSRLGTAASDVFLIGGPVRDLMLGREPRLLDLAVESEPEELVAVLGATARFHDRFGTATFTLDGFDYDVARTRTESYAAPGALPDVAPADIEHDLSRRDFTVNTLALAISGRRRGDLLSHGPAVDDLRSGTLRVLHDASFTDDPTRLLRLVRYASRLGFAIEPHTRSLAESATRDGALDTVSGSRLGAELRLLAREPDPIAALLGLSDLALDAALAPRFGLRDPDRARVALTLLPADGDTAALVIGAAGLEVAPRELAEMLERMSFEAGQRDAILATARDSERIATELTAAELPSELAAAVGADGPEPVALAGAMGPADQARRWLEELRSVRLEIDGHDLLRAGVPSGPAVGEGLRAALRAKLDGRITDRESELAEALRAARRAG
jgi:tRNA nucleotidyltransferase (CCA-adding enzyme)